jgi:uncharacterized protein
MGLFDAFKKKDPLQEYVDDFFKNVGIVDVITGPDIPYIKLNGIRQRSRSDIFFGDRERMQPYRINSFDQGLDCIFWVFETFFVLEVCASEEKEEDRQFIVMQFVNLPNDHGAMSDHMNAAKVSIETMSLRRLMSKYNTIEAIVFKSIYKFYDANTDWVLEIIKKKYSEKKEEEKLKIKPSVAKKKPAAKKVVAKKKPAAKKVVAKKKLEAAPTPIVNETVEPHIKAVDQAQHELGVKYREGDGVTQDYKKAMQLFRPLAEKGHGDSQFNLGQMYKDGNGVPQDYEEAIKWYRKAADQGLAEAQYNLGVMYDKGTGVTQDYEVAVKWYRKAAEQGHAWCQCILGFMYKNGKGVIQDYEETEKWLRLAADQGVVEAQFMLGIQMFLRGGLSDMEESMNWLQLAAEQGHTEAKKRLLTCYTKMAGIYIDNGDSKEAAKWFQLSADHGNEIAQLCLGSMYERGRGVIQNYVLAHMWYNLSASNGNKSAIKNRDIVTSQMTPTQIAEAQKMAQDWTKKEI